MKVDKIYTGIEEFEDLSPGDIFTLECDGSAESICLKLEKEVGGLSASELYNAVNIESGDLMQINELESCVLVKNIKVEITK